MLLRRFCPSYLPPKRGPYPSLATTPVESRTIASFQGCPDQWPCPSAAASESESHLPTPVRDCAESRLALPSGLRSHSGLSTPGSTSVRPRSPGSSDSPSRGATSYAHHRSADLPA